MEIQLGHRPARPCAGIGHPEPERQVLRRGHAVLRVGKRGIAQAGAEAVAGGGNVIIRAVPAAVLGIVVHRQLAGMIRQGNAEPSRRFRLPEQQPGHGLTAGGTGVEAAENRIRQLLYFRHFIGPPGNQHGDDGLAQRPQMPQQPQLAAGQTEDAVVDALATVHGDGLLMLGRAVAFKFAVGKPAGAAAQHRNHHIGVRHGRHGLLLHGRVVLKQGAARMVAQHRRRAGKQPLQPLPGRGAHAGPLGGGIIAQLMIDGVCVGAGQTDPHRLVRRQGQQAVPVFQQHHALFRQPGGLGIVLVREHLRRLRHIGMLKQAPAEFQRQNPLGRLVDPAFLHQTGLHRLFQAAEGRVP